MKYEQATDVRKEWSSVCDSVIRERPKFIKRTRDKMCLSSVKLMNEILAVYTFTAKQFTEPDGSVTIALDIIDITENGESEEDARLKIGKRILEYAEDYYENFQIYSISPDKKSHMPYIIKVLLTDNARSIGKSIICREVKR